jgi:hypothetical protein
VEEEEEEEEEKEDEEEEEGEDDEEGQDEDNKGNAEDKGKEKTKGKDEDKGKEKKKGRDKGKEKKKVPVVDSYPLKWTSVHRLLGGLGGISPLISVLPFYKQSDPNAANSSAVPTASNTLRVTTADVQPSFVTELLCTSQPGGDGALACALLPRRDRMEAGGVSLVCNICTKGVFKPDAIKNLKDLSVLAGHGKGICVAWKVSGPNTQRFVAVVFRRLHAQRVERCIFDTETYVTVEPAVESDNTLYRQQLANVTTAIAGDRKVEDVTSVVPVVTKRRSKTRRGKSQLPSGVHGGLVVIIQVVDLIVDALHHPSVQAPDASPTALQSLLSGVVLDPSLYESQRIARAFELITTCNNMGLTAKVPDELTWEHLVDVNKQLPYWCPILKGDFKSRMLFPEALPNVGNSCFLNTAIVNLIASMWFAQCTCGPQVGGNTQRLACGKWGVRAIMLLTLGTLMYRGGHKDSRVATFEALADAIRHTLRYPHQPTATTYHVLNDGNFHDPHEAIFLLYAHFPQCVIEQRLLWVKQKSTRCVNPDCALNPSRSADQKTPPDPLTTPVVQRTTEVPPPVPHVPHTAVLMIEMDLVLQTMVVTEADLDDDDDDAVRKAKESTEVGLCLRQMLESKEGGLTGGFRCPTCKDVNTSMHVDGFIHTPT